MRTVHRLVACTHLDCLEALALCLCSRLPGLHSLTLSALQGALDSQCLLSALLRDAGQKVYGISETALVPLLSNGKVGGSFFRLQASCFLEPKALFFLPFLLNTAAAKRQDTARCLNSAACTQMLDCVLAQ